MVPPDPLLTIAECLALGVATYPGRTTSRAHALAIAIALGASEEDAASAIALSVEQGLLCAEGSSLRAP